MKATIIFCIILALTIGASLAGWERTYGGSDDDYGESVAQTSDGGYIIAGKTSSFGAGYSDVYLVKTDCDGDTLWTRTYGGSYNDGGYSVAQTSDGGYIIAGYTDSFGGERNVYLVKTDAAGNTLWTRNYGGSDDVVGLSVAQTSDGGYIIAGWTTSFGAGESDFYLVKTDGDGDTLWTRTYGGSSGDYGYSVAQTSDGGYIIAGATSSFGAGNYDVYLVKTDAAGDTLWTRTYGGDADDVGYSVTQTSDGGYIVAGETYSFGTGWTQDVYLIRTDMSGDTLWTRTYGGIDNDCAYSVIQATDSGFIVAGYTNSIGAGYFDFYLIKTNSSGDTLWTRTYGGSNDDYGRSVAQTSDGGFIIAGGTSSFGAGGEDIYLIKTDSLGYTAIGESPTARPDEFAIFAYPNPFNSAVKISFTCHSRENGNPESGVVVEIFDIAGRRVADLSPRNCIRNSDPLIKGVFTDNDSPLNKGGCPEGTGGILIWRPDENIGSGIYLVRAKINGAETTKRIIFLK